MAGLKTISMLLLVVLVALAGVSPVFAQASITLTPSAACPGGTVTIFANIPLTDIVGGGISVAAVSPMGIVAVLSSDPGGLIANPACSPRQGGPPGSVKCAFLVSESAACGRYTVTVTIPVDDSGPSVSGVFDVAGPCCPAVGGCVQPVNTFAVLSPWLAVIGLVGCIAVGVVVKRRRS